MPSLEIICIGQTEPIAFTNFPFDVESGTERRSHRSPHPLFQGDFDRVQGCIYRVMEYGSVTVYDLLLRNWYGEHGNGNGRDENVEFREAIGLCIHQMLAKLIDASPERRILFTTDYQFGPEGAKRFGPMPLDEFWDLHTRGGLRMNALYELTAAELAVALEPAQPSSVDP